MLNTTILRKIQGDLLARKARSLLVSLSIFIGVVGVVALVSASSLLIQQMNKNVQPEHLPMLQLMVNTTDDTVTPADTDTLLAALQALPQITAVEGQANYPIFWKTSREDQFRSSFVFAYYAPYDQVALQPLTVKEGHFPVPGQRELAAEIRLAETYDLHIGDQVEVRVLGDPTQPAQIEQWTISAIVVHGYMLMDQTPHNKLFFTSYSDAQKIVGFSGFSYLNARFTDFPTAQQSVEPFLKTLRENSGYTPMFSFVTDPEKDTALELTRQLSQILSLLGVIAMLVSGLLVVTVITSLVAEQRRQIGVLKSIGGTRLEIFNVYAGIVLIYGLIGMIPGVLLGIPAGYWLAKTVGGFIDAFIDDFTISPAGIGLGMLLGVGVPVLAAALPVYTGTRISILEAMTDTGIETGYQTGKLGTLINLLPLPMLLKPSLRNIVQKKARLALTVFTLIIALTAFMGVTAIFQSLNQLVDELAHAFDFQIQVIPASPQDYEAVRQTIKTSVPEVDEVYSANILTTQIEGHTEAVAVMGMPTDGSVINLHYSEGTGWDQDADRQGIVMTSVLAHTLEKSVGDHLSILLGGQYVEVEIIGIFNFPIAMIAMNWQTLAQQAGIVSPSGEPLQNSYIITTQDRTISAREVDTLITKVNMALVEEGITSTISNQTEQIEMFSQLVIGLGVIFNMASLVMAGVGAIGLLMALSLSVLERQKEIGVMRSLGASSWHIIMQFLTEGIVVGVIAWVFAVPLSIMLAEGMYALLPFQDIMTFHYPVILLVLGLLSVLGIAAAASILPAMMAARKTVSDILRYQ